MIYTVCTERGQTDLLTAPVTPVTTTRDTVLLSLLRGNNGNALDALEVQSLEESLLDEMYVSLRENRDLET